jgi:outer membrane protein, heavy metal efflux system
MRTSGTRSPYQTSYALIFVFVCLATTIAAQSPARLSLTDAISRARRDHPLIVAAQQRVAMAEALMLEAGLKPNPSLTLSGENFPLGPTQNGFDISRSVDWFATFSQTFETGGKRRLRTETAGRNLEYAQAESAAVERRVLYEVKIAYQRLAMARIRLSLTQENLNTLDQLVGLNEVRVREGYTAEGDLIKVKLEGQRIGYQVKKAQLDVDRARIELLRSMGAAAFDAEQISFEIVEELDDRPITPKAIALEEAAMHLPEVLAAQKALDRAQAQLRLEQSRSRPDVVASVGFKRNGPDNALYAAVNIPLPIYNRNQAQIAHATAAVGAAEAEFRHERNKTLAELASARRAVELNRQQVDSLRADFLLRADESRSISLAAYREGAADLLTLLDAQRVRTQAREFYFQALYEYQISIHELERAAGVERLPRRPEGQSPARTPDPTQQTSNEQP